MTKANIKIIFENQDIIVVDKPPLMLSTPARQADDPRPVLGRILEVKGAIYPVHRLDFEVSGLIIYAKNKEAHRIANGWFESKLILKTYEAITEGTEENLQKNQKYIWLSKLVRGKKRTFKADHGQSSETWAFFKEKMQNELLRWHLQPITGRSHQIRFELSNRGYPIVGDLLYGSKIKNKNEGIALRAIEINLDKIDNRLGLPRAITVV